MQGLVKIGHWTGDGTGVTVVVPPPGTVGSGEVRGGAPATREFALLEPSKMMDRVDAVVMSGGSAFGLAAADGVMGVLYEREMGFPTMLGAVPIVVGMSLYDGAMGPAAPGAEHGRLAALKAFDDDVPVWGKVGAGTGATTGKWRMVMHPGGLGYAEQKVGDATIAAIAAVNSFGDVLGVATQALSEDTPPGWNTTLVTVVTDARLSKMECFLLAQGGHDGLARAIDPVHTRFDGDAVVALATGTQEEAGLDGLRIAVPHVVSAAIRKAVTG
jgi:L-aminopeptidase/D-esterase-like protein